MSGVKLKVEIDDRKVRDALNRLLRSGKELSPVLKEIGEHLLDSTRQRFSDKTAPDDTTWDSLSPTYQKRKKKNANKILVLDGHLSGTLRYQIQGNTLLLGSDRIYAAIHQFGAKQGAFGKTKGGKSIPWGDIPARPYLGVSDDDERDIVNILHDHLQDAWLRR